jgi:hypothetical protein
MTTQVSVHRGADRKERDSEEELENIDGKSVGTASPRANEIGDDIISPSSSQIRSANGGV